MRQEHIEAMEKVVASLEAISEIVYSIGHPDEDAAHRINSDIVAEYLRTQIEEAALQIGDIIDQYREVTA